MENTIKKFMDSLNLKLHIYFESGPKYIMGGELYCFKTYVTGEKNKDYELLFYSCWTKKRNSSHDIRFEGANWDKSSELGIFAYLGENKKVDNYFYNLTKDYAIKYIADRQ